MSDSAEGDVPGPGAKTGTTAPTKAPIEPETAERFASAFVPAWQFEDAPFSPGPSLSAGEIRDLGAVSNANSPQDVPSAAPAIDPFPSAARDETIRTEPSVVVASDVLREAMAVTAVTARVGRGEVRCDGGSGAQARRDPGRSRADRTSRFSSEWELRLRSS